MKSISVLVEVQIDDEADPISVIQDVDYSFSLDGKELSTEITELYDHDETRIF